jgi:hypothetical protein
MNFNAAVIRFLLACASGLRQCINVLYVVLYSVVQVLYILRVQVRVLAFGVCKDTVLCTLTWYSLRPEIKVPESMLLRT